MHEFHIFGSVCRGEPDVGSDVDVLVVSDDRPARKELPPSWSYYSRRRIRALFARGTLFAWHLYLESVKVWPRRGCGYLQKIGPPKPYTGAVREIGDLQRVLLRAIAELERGTHSSVYEFGLVSLACRDAAMAAFPVIYGRFDFSRHAPLHLAGNRFPLSTAQFDYLLACRRATTRGGGLRRQPRIERQVISNLPRLKAWCKNILVRLKNEQFSPQN